MKKNNKENLNLQIFSIEGKDLLTKYYTLNNNSNRKGSFDDSIEIDAIEDMFPHQFVKRNQKTGRLYTNDIITVTFEYSCHKDRDLTDEEYERLESLRLTQSLLTDKTQISEVKKLIKLAERDITKKEIRNQLYKYGFNIRINNKCIHFTRYKRTSGSARVGKCLFINEKYAKKMIDWSFAGIPHEEGQKLDCASMEAYISLPTSSSIDRFKLKPENILLIDDEFSKFEDTVMATKLVNKEYNEDGNVIRGDLFTDIETTTIENNIFDGESLLDKSVFEKYGYGDKATLQVRNRFFKGICVNTDIQKFFKDNGITKVSQLNGKTIATDISQIKLITTPSSVKYLKFDTFEKWLNHLVENWGICKYEKPQHHFNGMAQTHYQLLNTLGMNKDEMRFFLKDSIDYAWLLKTNIAAFKYHIGLNKTDDEEDIIIEERLRNNVNTTSDFILNMLAINDDFQYSKIFKDYRKEVIKSYTNNLRKGHVLVNGNYSVMVSCPYEYLLASIGRFDGTSKTLGNYECYSNKFDDNEEILGVRSPQPTMANIVLFTNNKCEILDKYFNTNSKEVIYVSPIGNNLLSILSGADFDR